MVPDIVCVAANEDTAGEAWLDVELDVIAGDPQCRVRRLRTEGRTTKFHRAALFAVEPCTFRWNFARDESWIVLQGRATVTFDAGETIELMPGTVASVVAGRTSTWVVHEPIRKFLVVSSAEG